MYEFGVWSPTLCKYYMQRVHGRDWNDWGVSSRVPSDLHTLTYYLTMYIYLLQCTAYNMYLYYSHFFYNHIEVRSTYGRRGVTYIFTRCVNLMYISNLNIYIDKLGWMIYDSYSYVFLMLMLVQSGVFNMRRLGDVVAGIFLVKSGQ